MLRTANVGRWNRNRASARCGGAAPNRGCPRENRHAKAKTRLMVVVVPILAAARVRLVMS